MKALILAAGKGTRLKKYTQNLPKGMLSFAGKTIIERQIEMYRKIGIDDIIIVKGFAADKISYKNVKYYINKDYENTNMVETLLTAKEEFNDDFVVSYSDILFEYRLLQGIVGADSDFCVAVDDAWKPYWQKRYGKEEYDLESLSINENNEIVELGLENPDVNDISARYIGLLKFSKYGMQKIVSIMTAAHTKYSGGCPWQQSGNPVKKAYMTDLLNALIEDGESVVAVRFNHGWLEFDTNEDYENACEWLENGDIKMLIRGFGL